MTFYRAYAYLAAPLLILALALSMAFDLGIGPLASAAIALTIAAVAAALISWFSNKVGAFASMVYTGSGHISAKERHASNITRARYLKTQGNFEDALAVIDEYLDLVPGDPEGLFLKAQILMTSAGDLALARRCLDSVIKNAPADVPFHRWAKELRASQRNGRAD